MSIIDKINVVTWNAQGLLKKDSFGNYICKTEHEEFEKLITDAHIICLTETWTCDDNIDNVNINGFAVFFSNRKIKHKHSKRNNGGVIVFVKDSLRKGVSKQHSASDDLLWLKFNKTFFNTEKDLYICTAYLAPQNSSFFSWQNIDVLDILECEVEKYSNLGLVTICGDLNARTQCKSDIISDDSDNFIPLPSNYVVQDSTHLSERNNLDSVENQYGIWLVNLCISKQLVILNGRTTGDTVGNYTYYGPNGSSTIDYFIVHESLFKNVNYLKILELTTLSDHCAVLMSINLPVKPGSGNEISSTKGSNSSYKLRPHIKKFVWDGNSNEQYKLALEYSQLELDSIFPEKRTVNENDLNGIISNFNSYIFQISKKSLKLISPKKKLHKKKKSKLSFDSDCMHLKSQMKYKLKLMNRFPHNRTYREDYYKFRRDYRKTIKLKEIEYKDNILHQLETLRESDSKSYWSLLNKLKNSNKKADTDSISPQEWASYFKNLSYKKSLDIDLDFKNKLASKEQENYLLNDLDYPITEKELHDQISRLKVSGSSSLDLISNQMIRTGRYYLTPFLLKLYNACLDKSYFPRDWNIGLLTPIYKKGPKNDPGNFRGIAITSTLGKILTAILQSRLVSFLTDGNKLNENQSGFLPGHRTSDNIFILSQFMELNKKLKNPIFLAFIDFKKAFDTVWHGGLLLKLLNKGIGGKFYNLIKSIYNQDARSENQSQAPYNSQISPSLYSRYINDDTNSRGHTPC